MSFFDRSFGSPIGPLKNGLKNGKSTAQLIEKGFAPQNNKIDVLLINPPSSISERYGKENKSNFIKNKIGSDEKNVFKKFLLNIFIW